jgi:protein-tyrosine-phosphatase
MSAPRPRAVLFACNLNTIRSPIAAGLLRRYAGGLIHVESCGVWPGGQMDPFMVEVMREKRIDLSEHQPRVFEDLADASFDQIIAFTEDSYMRALQFARTLAAEVEHWPIGDPSAGGETRDMRLEAYRAVRDEIDDAIRSRLNDRSTPGA